MPFFSTKYYCCSAASEHIKASAGLSFPVAKKTASCHRYYFVCGLLFAVAAWDPLVWNCYCYCYCCYFRHHLVDSVVHPADNLTFYWTNHRGVLLSKQHFQWPSPALCLVWPPKQSLYRCPWLSRPPLHVPFCHFGANNPARSMGNQT